MAWQEMQPIKIENLPEEVLEHFHAIQEDDPESPTPLLWHNDQYLAQVYIFEELEQLSVQRKDGAPVDGWDDLQEIKSDIFGPEFEAVELYPAEDRLVNMGNTRHLWVRADGSPWPFGFQPLVPFNFEDRS